MKITDAFVLAMGLSALGCGAANGSNPGTPASDTAALVTPAAAPQRAPVPVGRTAEVARPAALGMLAAK